jgi:hypothetical protein
MRKITRLAILAVIPLALFGARLTLRSGSVVDGRFISGSSDRIVFEDTNGMRRTFSTNEIQTLDFNDSVGPAAIRDRPDDNQSRDRQLENRDRADTRGRAWTTLPTGSQISVRTDETINSDNVSEGRTYPASIQADVLDTSGNVVIPRGSRANLIVRRATEGGTFTSGNLILDLDSVEVSGRRYDVSTEDVSKAGANGIGANRRTGEMVGGGAVLGTLLGAVAGGGKGAAIGAIAGAAAGGGVQVLTKGKEIRVPAETVLNFRLDQPLSLREH